MSVTKPAPVRRTAAPYRPSRVRIAAVWFALLLCSFLFGMLIISPLLGVVMSGPEKEKPAAARPSRTAPAPRTSTIQQPRQRPTLSVEENTRRVPGPGISLSPDESDSTVHAADPIEPSPEPEAAAPAPLPGNAVTPPAPSAVPPSGGLSVEENPVPNPQIPGEIQRGERID